MLRVALHVLVSGSLLAGPPTNARNYVGEEAVEAVEAVAPTEVTPATPTSEAPTSEAPASEVPASQPPASEVIASETPAQVPAVTPATDAERAPAPVKEGPVEEEVEEDEGPKYDPLVDSPEALKARSWVRSGVAFMVIGGVLAIGAIAMSTAKVNTVEDQDACNAKMDIAGNGCLENAKNRAVAAMAVPGGLLLAGGIAMLALGKVQQKRLRASLRASRRELVIGVQLAF